MIKGIDTQIMITRAADLSRDASANIRHPQFAQENLAARTLSESTANQSRVQEAVESENENIRTDAEGGGGNAAGGGGGPEEEEEEMTEEQERELLVAPSSIDHRIDIMI